MRLHRLELIGVGPFRERQEIDFDALSESGLFLIDGPTGSGKTTIIDAIVYALFGDVSGGAESAASRMRSTFCSDDDPTGVSLEFTVDGRRHRITRVPAHARDPQQPGRAPKRVTSQVLTELADDGSDRLVLVRSGEVRRHVEGLLDMTSEQFRQLVVLPQGRFADLLRMSPTERLAALATLLDHDELFRRVQDDLKLRGLQAEDLRREARAAAQAQAQGLAGRLRVHLDAQDPPAAVDVTDASASDEARLAVVDALLASLGGQAEDAARERDALATTAQALRASALHAQEVVAALAAVLDAQEAVQAAERGLDSQDTDVPATEVPLRIGSLRVKEGALGEHAEWESQGSVRAADRADRAAQETAHRAAAQGLREQKASIPEQRADLERRRAEAQALAGTAATAADEQARCAVLVGKAEELAALTPRLDQAASALADAQERAVAATVAVTAAHEAWVDLVDRQRGDQAARLASLLEPGGSCPVCGSVDHPHPAQPSHGHALVVDEQVTTARRIADEAHESAQAATAAVTAARDAWLGLERQVSVLGGALGDRTPEQIRAEYQAAVAAVDAADEAGQAVVALEAALLDVAEAEGSLDAAIAEQETQAASIHGALAQLEAAEAEGLGRVRVAIGDAESATALLAHTRARIAALTALQESRAALDAAAASVPALQRQLSVDEARAAADAAEVEADAAERAHTAMSETAATLAATVTEASPMRDRLAAALAHRRAVDDQTAAAVSLAQLAAGVNTRKLPLRSYALQRRFESVLAAATVHLERMSAGKFSFELDDEAAAGHSGLGIVVHDAWTGHRQDPKALSGGETFYAALSLALGLADVVRGEAGGSALETLFIDEGFGSLDQDTLYQVLDQLDAMRSGGRVVGVISHVTEMKESIPDRIEVLRGPDRTSCVRRPGADLIDAEPGAID